jgi:hypothetical protein
MTADPPDLGPCCNCGATAGVINVMMLDKRAPTPGKGWGCVVCNLPADGAVAVLCDDCVEQPIKAVCDGYPNEGKRVPIEQLSDEVFQHDPKVDHG